MVASVVRIAFVLALMLAAGSRVAARPILPIAFGHAYVYDDQRLSRDAATAKPVPFTLQGVCRSGRLATSHVYDCAWRPVSSAPQKFTGKERDAETGLDYFGARYFSGAQGRFTSPDPLVWQAWQMGSAEDQERFERFISDPQNFNLYAYVHNNPLRFTDPTGMYYCTGTTTECKAFEDALQQARSQLSNKNLSKEKKDAIRKVLTFYGIAQDPNGVVVKFEGGRNAAMDTDTARVYGQITTTVTVDPGEFSKLNLDARAEAAVHEGIHGISGLARGRHPNAEAEVMATELDAYRTQSYVPEGLGVVSPWGVWNPTWPRERAEANRTKAVGSRAAQSTAEWCKASGRCR